MSKFTFAYVLFIVSLFVFAFVLLVGASFMAGHIALAILCACQFGMAGALLYGLND